MARRGGYSSTNLRCYNSKQSKKYIFYKDLEWKVFASNGTNRAA